MKPDPSVLEAASKDLAALWRESLVNSPELHSYLTCRETLLANDKIAPTYRYYKELAKQGGDSFDEKRRLSGLYWDLYRHPEGAAFFDAEETLAKHLHALYGELDEAFSGLDILG